MPEHSVVVRPCPRCAQPMPHRRRPSPHTDVQIDWTCYVCLHAEVAALKRQLADVEAATR